MSLSIAMIGLAYISQNFRGVSGRLENNSV